METKLSLKLMFFGQGTVGTFLNAFEFSSDTIACLTENCDKSQHYERYYRYFHSQLFKGCFINRKFCMIIKITEDLT